MGQSSLGNEEGAEIPVDLNPNGTVNMEPPSLMVTPATPSRRLSTDPGPSEASSTAGITTEEAENEGAATKTEIVQPESKPEGGVKKSSGNSASATSNVKAANGKTKSSGAKPARPNAKETEGTSKMGSKGMAGTKSTKTTASEGVKTTVGKGDPTKATGTTKPTGLSKAPASGGARPKVGATSALKGDQKEAKLNDKKLAVSKPASKPPVLAEKTDAARPGKAPSSVSTSGTRTRAPPSTAAEIAKKTSAKPMAGTSPAKTSSLISEGKARTVSSTRPTTRPASSTTGALSKPAPPSARAATRPTSSSTAPRSTGSSTASRAGSAASSASPTSSLRRTPASQGPSTARPPVKTTTEGSRSGAVAKVPSASRPRLASTTKPKTLTTTTTTTMAGGGRATTTTTSSSSRGTAPTRPTSSTADRSAVPARSPVKPSAAASRVAAARAAAKAAKPPPARKTSEGKASPVRNPSASPVRKVPAAQDLKSEVMEAAGEQENPEVGVAITENGALALAGGGDKILESSTVKDQGPEEDGRQNGEETSVGQVTVNGEQEDIGTSEC